MFCSRNRQLKASSLTTRPGSPGRTDNNYSAVPVQSAHFFLTEATGSAYEPVYLHPQNTTSDWDESTATWSNVGYYDNGWWQGASMGYCETESFDITELVQRWKNGLYDSGWCGFILVSEWQSTIDKALYACEHSTTSRRPYAVVEYSLPDSTVNLDEGSSTTYEVSPLNLMYNPTTE